MPNASLKMVLVEIDKLRVKVTISLKPLLKETRN